MGEAFTYAFAIRSDIGGLFMQVYYLLNCALRASFFASASEPFTPK